MRRIHRIPCIPLAASVLALTLGTGALQAQSEESQAVSDGGIHVPGWQGRIDAREAEAGQVLGNARLASHGDALHVMTGPAVSYWNPEYRASGTYTVSATFHEPEYMNLNNHPHPYGLFIGGREMGTDRQTYLYCAAYGNGSFIVRGFGPEPFQMNGRRPEPHDAVNKAAGRNEPVTQEIALSVTDDTVECRINGTVVASYPKSDVVKGGQLQSTDGIYGLRFGHNTEATVTGLGLARP